MFINKKSVSIKVGVYTTILSTSILFSGCVGHSETNNTQAVTTTNNNSTSSIAPNNAAVRIGTLMSEQLSSTVDTSSLQQFMQGMICPSGMSKMICNRNLDNLQSNYNFSINQIGTNNPYNIKEVNEYSIVYSASNGDYHHVNALSGAVLIPNVSPSTIKGIILFFHPTIVNKFSIPSCFSAPANWPNYCQNQGNPLSSYTAGMYASQGYIVVEPDYPGQGIDNSVMHPYVAFPKPNAFAGIDMLGATRQLLTNLNIVSPNTKLNLFLNGYSEGGAYTLWASRLLQTTAQTTLKNNNLNLILTVPMSGAYDLKTAEMPFLFSNVSSPTKESDPYNILDLNVTYAVKPILSAYVLSSIAYYKPEFFGYNDIFTPQFYNLDCGSKCLINGQQYNLNTIFNTDSLTTEQISGTIENASQSAINTQNNLLYSKANNSAYAFTYEPIMHSPEMDKLLFEAEIDDWKTISPITLLYLSHDSVVTNLSSQSAYKLISQQSASGLMKQIISNNDIYCPDSEFCTTITAKPHLSVTLGIDHPSAMEFLMAIALEQFNNTN